MSELTALTYYLSVHPQNENSLTSNELSSYPGVDTDLLMLEKSTTVVEPNAEALPSMTKLQDYLNAEKKKVSIVSETAKQLDQERKEQLSCDSIVNMLKDLELKLEARWKKDREEAEALRKKDREEAEALRKKDLADAEALRMQDAENVEALRMQDEEMAEALRKKEREEDKKWVEEQNCKLGKDIKELENEIKLFKQHESEREDRWKQRHESTQLYLESFTSDINGFFATGDEAALDRIKCRDLLNRAQASLAMSLGLSNDSVDRCSASFQFREALGPSLAVEDRQKVLLAMLEEKKDELPSQAVLLMTKPEALKLLAERYPRVRLDGDQVVGKDMDALTSLLDYVSPPMSLKSSKEI